MPEKVLTSNEPYCSNCGYALKDLVNSSKCPECGKPLVEVLTRRHQFAESGKRYRSAATLFGLPVIDIALGPKNGELRGKAKGIIAIGDVATGWLAIGGLARGFVAIGGMAIGLFAIGGVAAGLFTLGGGALGGIAAGGGAVGGLAAGGGAIGFGAQGGGAVGYFARGGGAFGVHTITMVGSSSPQATHFFDQFSWFFGTWPPNAISSLQPFVVTLAGAVCAALVICTLAMSANRRKPNEQAPWIER